MSIPPYMAEQFASQRQYELIAEAARVRRVQRKRFRLLALAGAVRRSLERSSATTRPRVVATAARAQGVAAD